MYPNDIKNGLISIYPIELDSIERTLTGITDVRRLNELRNEVVESYNLLRDPDVDRGRLPWEAMNNVMKITGVIDFMISKYGGVL